MWDTGFAYACASRLDMNPVQENGVEDSRALDQICGDFHFIESKYTRPCQGQAVEPTS